MKQQQQLKQKKKRKKNEKRDKKIYKVVTGSAVVDFFGCIRDSAIIGNTIAFNSDYVIVNKTAFMKVCNITLMFITYCSLSIQFSTDFRNLEQVILGE